MPMHFMFLWTTFLSTPSARRATDAQQIKGYLDKLFLSTPSARRATNDIQIFHDFSGFLSTPSARRARSEEHTSVLQSQR